VNGHTLTLGLVAGLAMAGLARHRKGSAARGSFTRGRAGAWTHNEGFQGTGEEIIGTLDEDPVGTIYLFRSPTQLNSVLRREEYSTFSGLPRGKTGWLGAIELPEDARGFGIGTQIVTEMLEKARSLGARSVVLHADSYKSKRFWSKMGFTVVEMRKADLQKGLWMTPMMRVLEDR